MDPSPKVLGLSLRQLFASVIRRPMGWSLIDAFARLEEREEAERATEPSNDNHWRPKETDRSNRS